MEKLLLFLCIAAICGVILYVLSHDGIPLIVRLIILALCVGFLAFPILNQKGGA